MAKSTITVVVNSTHDVAIEGGAHARPGDVIEVEDSPMTQRQIADGILFPVPIIPPAPRATERPAAGKPEQTDQEAQAQ